MEVQLAKTTPYLSGQQRIDIELKADSSNITDNRIHIVPLSDNIVFNENNNRVILNYTHEDNLKDLYNKTKDSFWSNIKERNDTIYWKKAGTILDTYDHTYQSGTRRIRYKRYNKQFSSLVPIWIEQEWQDDWAFRITINTQSYTLLTRKIILFSEKFKNYLKAYTKNLNNEVININSERNEIFVNGLKVDSGISLLKDVSYKYNSIISRERPLIEFDSMLCSSFVDNNMIAKQLLNLNFIFNINDIVSVYQSSLMDNNKWNIYIEFGEYNGTTFTPFPKKDFYTNYNFIPKYKLGKDNGTYTNDNVFDYLEDNKCVDFIYSNKTTQPICHWALKENPDYIYNFYNGFSPINNNNNQDSKNYTGGMFFNTPILDIKDFDVKLNNIGWCKRLYNKDSTYINGPFNDKKNFTEIPIDPKGGKSYWIETLKYILKNDVDFDLNSDFTNKLNKIYFQLVYNDSNIFQPSQQQHSINIQKGQNTKSFYLNYVTNPSTPQQISEIEEIYLSLITYSGNIDCIDWFTFKNFKDLIIDNGDKEPGASIAVDVSKNILISLQEIMKDVSVPTKFVFNKGVIPVKANNKNKNTNEITYLKSDINTYSYVYRYTDNIKPMFIDCNDNNILYNEEWKCRTFEKFTDELAKTYNDNILSKDIDVYPSIDYFALEKVDNDKTKYNTVPSMYCGYDEFSWFSKSIYYKLPETINIIVYLIPDDQSPTFPTVNEFTNNTPYLALKNYFQNISTQPTHFDYIFNLYTYKYNFEYAAVDNINNINYYITYTLK